ncbi:MAG: YfiR family protein [Bacteroidales bacterium]|nr:YfiR family protein [Bacteroidales bacterium]
MKRLFFIIFLFSILANISYGQVEISRAQANFIYNFTKFFDWPQTEKTGDFVIGVFGSRELATNLEKVTSGKKNVTQNIVVKYFSKFDQISKCHVIFVASVKSNKIASIHTKTGMHCLIISDSRSAINNGAAIRFVLESDRLKYEFSKGNALKHGLKFHSKISEMASKNY